MSATCGNCGRTLQHRTHAVYLGKGKARFYYPCGHVAVELVFRARRGLPRPGEAAAKAMAGWWSCEKGGVNAECRKCSRAAKVQAKEQPRWTRRS